MPKTTQRSSNKEGASSPLLVLLHELYCWLAVTTIFLAFQYGGTWGSVAHSLVGSLGACVADYFVSPTLGRNMNRIVQRGLAANHLQIWISIYLTIVVSETLLIALCKAGGGLDDHAAIMAGNISLPLLVRVGILIAVSELTFTAVHCYLLHGTQWGATIHAIHHSCRPSTFATSYMFHLWDANFEFSVSQLTMFGVHQALFPSNDGLSLKLALMITHVWYTVVSHSEHLKSGHYFHHAAIQKHYAVYYTDWQGTPSHDYVPESLQSMNDKNSRSLSKSQGGSVNFSTQLVLAIKGLWQQLVLSHTDNSCLQLTSSNGP